MMDWGALTTDGGIFLGGVGTAVASALGVWQHNRTKAAAKAAQVKELQDELAEKIIDGKIANAIGVALASFDAKVTARFNHNDKLTNDLSLTVAKIQTDHFGNGIGLRGTVDQIDGKVDRIGERVAKLEGRSS